MAYSLARVERESSTWPGQSAAVRKLTSVVLEPANATSGLPLSYERARERLLSLERPSRIAVNDAWKWLLTWRRLLADRHGSTLDPPHIFANEHGVVEFEWENEQRFLMLRLHVEQPTFDYLRVDEDAGIDEPGTAGIADVCDLLLWFLGRRHAGSGH